MKACLVIATISCICDAVALADGKQEIILNQPFAQEKLALLMTRVHNSSIMTRELFFILDDMLL